MKEQGNFHGMVTIPVRLVAKTALYIIIHTYTYTALSPTGLSSGCLGNYIQWRK
jgi:hypothetical protein